MVTFNRVISAELAEDFFYATALIPLPGVHGAVINAARWLGMRAITAFGISGSDEGVYYFMNIRSGDDWHKIAITEAEYDAIREAMHAWYPHAVSSTTNLES